ncbi:sulfotransferase family protein [Actibacterium pelagium]|uniref:Sulfotransferase family protein n=1 Tax=Actibacterium pelagium TaxID=2029103 RepID=A0A917AEW6_9RHOB|nr:sulfotransferase family protein [Actibacterium pelagium]GGE47636.1 sulfotransferase family protein [Actibacterium pelagium]
MPLKVIGAGFARTGTDSMREALEILGFGPCHHMFEVMSNPVQMDRWRAFVKGADHSWEELFEGYASCTDLPSAHYWQELSKAYPDAPVIMNWRDPESWWPSYEALRAAADKLPHDPDSLLNTLIVPKVMRGLAHTKENAIGVLKDYYAAVQATIPPERLLVHKLGDGWAPLCKHLGVPVPDVPYPHRNTKGGLDEKLKTFGAKD